MEDDQYCEKKDSRQYINRKDAGKPSKRSRYEYFKEKDEMKRRHDSPSPSLETRNKKNMNTDKK